MSGDNSNLGANDFDWEKLFGGHYWTIAAVEALAEECKEPCVLDYQSHNKSDTAKAKLLNCLLSLNDNYRLRDIMHNGPSMLKMSAISLRKHAKQMVLRLLEEKSIFDNLKDLPANWFTLYLKATLVMPEDLNPHSVIKGCKGHQATSGQIIVFRDTFVDSKPCKTIPASELYKDASIGQIAPWVATQLLTKNQLNEVSLFANAISDPRALVEYWLEVYKLLK